MGKNGVLGIIVPIFDDDVMHDIFHGKSVYASLAPNEQTDLDEGDRLVFYDSAETHKLEGEAVITNVAFEPASRVLAIDEGAFFQDRRRLTEYISSLREGQASILRVIRFRDPTMYASPVKCGLTIPEHGFYLTADVFSRIVRENV